ncbi:MAG: divalent metal cation transporter, partial [Planctomycetota bacterium]
MTSPESAESLSREDALLNQAEGKGPLGKAVIYTLLSGPGWLQGAITLGGGSLAGALYLGVLMGYELMWLQPLAMIFGVIMLSAISYVALSTGERPFQTLKVHISPVLAWGWLIATMMANIVWSLPQFALGTAAVQQNLLPGLNTTVGKAVIAVALLIAASIVVWFYNSGSKGIRLFELILKAMVGIVVLSFFGVVAAMTANGALNWGEILAGFIPNPKYLFEPVPSMADPISETGGNAEYWQTLIAAKQTDTIITAFATAVGINMTFLLPYSMLRKGWGRRQRGLAIYDLTIGLIFPFVLATGCVVVAAASQFHASPDDVLAMEAEGLSSSKEVEAFVELVEGLEKSVGEEKLTDADRRIAAMLASRDNLSLAKTLSPLVGDTVAQKLFGVGVLGMALSTIIILMLINGFAFCELMDVPAEGTMHRIGCFLPAIGVFGPYFGGAAPALAIPTSVIGGAMLPIAYLSFFLLMNSKPALGDSKPTGLRACIWNSLMGLATLAAGFACVWGLSGKGIPGYIGLAIVSIM